MISVGGCSVGWLVGRSVGRSVVESSMYIQYVRITGSLIAEGVDLQV